MSDSHPGTAACDPIDLRRRSGAEGDHPALAARVGIALLVSTLIGVPMGVLLGLTHTRLHGLITAVLYTGMGLPPVVVGLFVYLFLSRSGPLGPLGWLFTPKAMVAAQIDHRPAAGEPA